MDDTPAHGFFLRPTTQAQRLYEALRAVVIEGCRQKDVADRFGYGYAAFRQQLTRFRARCAAGQPPPFARPSPRTAHPASQGPPAGVHPGGPNAPLSPTAVP
jgi:hypothetical protein